MFKQDLNVSVFGGYDCKNMTHLNIIKVLFYDQDYIFVCIKKYSLCKTLKPLQSFQKLYKQLFNYFSTFTY